MMKTNEIPELKCMHMMTDADRLRFAECSGRAYVGYPLLNWLFKGQADLQHSQNIWRSNYAAFTPSVLAYSESAAIKGTAVFVRPGGNPVSVAGFLRYGIRSLWHYLPRIIRYSLLCESVFSRHRDQDTWYLYDLAVDPLYQGKGVATQLLRPMLAYLDRTGAKCYLETHDAKNVAMYEHFGFELVESPRMPHAELRHYAMLRKSRP